MILPYCIIAESRINVPSSGVRQAAVLELTCDGLRCLYSAFSKQPESFNQEDALRFYATVQAVFDQVAVIPFRFPTVIETEQQLQAFLRENAPGYAAALHRLRDLVQMELRISPAEYAPAGSTSGTDYMTQRLHHKQRLEAAAEAARARVSDICVNWLRQETREGLRCYVLVDRQDVSQFEQRTKSLASGDDVRVSVSGPWPATEFIE
ncbi:MAG: GvpL/GvpF family gas vesicle protein [Acidobacteriales bacterium]|nr:GvpL/GvpF family gas vesicle protein [Terriglobales bacterium]